MFKCKVCEEKDKRLNDLKDEVKYLRSLLRSPVDMRASATANLEANAILNGVSEQIEVPEEVLAERAALLDGTY